MRLASIVSVTLGVATLIIVNAVMAGFTEEANKRLNGILSDIVFESHSLNGFGDPEWHKAEIRKILGRDLAGMTATVSVPAMLSIPVGRDQYLTRQVNLIGVDEQTYAEVGDFGQYLLHPENRRQLSFGLREEGYAPERAKFPPSGWRYRRARIMYERAYEEQVALEREKLAEQRRIEQGRRQSPRAAAEPAVSADPYDSTVAADPYAPREAEAPKFDPMTQQSTGIILGIAVCSQRMKDDTGEVRDFFFCRPGDDVKITIPTAGSPPTAVNDVLTVVDLYESKMSEYDASLAFMPLGALQNLRGMFDASAQRAVCHIDPDQAQAGHRSQRRARSAAESFPGHEVPVSHSDLARHARTVAGGRAAGDDDPEHPAVPDHRRGRVRHPGDVLHDRGGEDTRCRHLEGTRRAESRRDEHLSGLRLFAGAGGLGRRSWPGTAVRTLHQRRSPPGSSE